MKDVVEDLKKKLPGEKIKLLEKSIELPQQPEQQKTLSRGQVKQELPPKGLERQGSVEKISVEYSDNGRFNVRKGMSRADEAELMQLILDCGGILRTLITTHDINLKSNVFLQNLFSLSRKYKKECHEISNALVSLSSKIKSVH